jgi:hypothetical protein
MFSLSLSFSLIYCSNSRPPPPPMVSLLCRSGRACVVKGSWGPRTAAVAHRLAQPGQRWWARRNWSWGFGVWPTNSPPKNVYVEKTSKIPRKGLINRRRSDLTFGTWNVRTPFNTGALICLLSHCAVQTQHNSTTGRDKLGIEKNGGAFWERPRPGRDCSAIHGLS